MHTLNIIMQTLIQTAVMYVSALCIWYNVCMKYAHMYSRGQKKRDTRCYSGTYHRREMKLVPFFIEKCPL